jgi:putative chitinase
VTTFTLAQLLRLAPNARESYREAFGRVDVLRVAGLLEPQRLAHFLAQVCHETGGLTILVENLHYTSAERLTAVWPTRFRTRASALPFVGQPELLAEHVYGGRNGNIEPGDGWRYRGRGLLQLTGRDAYARIGTTIGVDLVSQPAQAVSAEHALSVGIAVWKWKGCDAPADADDIVKVTRLINGGTTGLKDRREWLVKAKAVIVEGVS